MDSDFSKGDIFATAFVSSVKEDSFHYTLSIMKDHQKAIKVHVREHMEDQFVFQAVEQSLRESRTLCTALYIGNIGDRKSEDVVELLKNIPLILPECDKEVDHRFRCRVFLKQCIRSMHGAGIINCPDADAVVNGELKSQAKENGQAILLGRSEYVLAKSKISS